MGTAEAEPIRAGSTFGSLIVERELGRGAFGVVFLARDTMLGRQVALKTVARPELHLEPAALASFLDEARVVARLNSPNVVTLYQLHERPGGHWVLEMEYVQGPTLRERMQSAEGLNVEDIRRILRGLATGLKAAHDAGVLHRDIKPANVLVARDGTAKLTDFGLARVVNDESVSLERDESIVGTPAYMAPEILLNESASVASDLWSLGVLAYQLLAGRLPFESGNLATFFFTVQNAPPLPLAPIIGPQLREFVARCLVKDPASRARSCVELLEILDSREPVAPERVAEPLPRSRQPLLGRSAEVAQFQTALDRVRDGAATGILLVGEAGIGKSTLVDEVRSAAASQGFVWLSAVLSPFEGPLHTLVEAVQASARSEHSWRTAAFGPASGIVAKLLRGDAVPELETPEQAVWALEHLFRGVATERPLCLCVEEARHAQNDDVALLSDLMRRLADSRFLMVVTARPEAPALARIGALPIMERLTLEGLPGEALYSFLEQSSGAERVPPEVAAHILRRSDGNPLLAAEMLRHLEAVGSVVRNGDRLEARSGWDSDAVPQQLHDLVAARLASLDEDDRALLEAAAVDGREFDGRALAAVSELPLIQVLRRLQGLCRSKTLIVPSDDGYRFANPLLQQVLYEEMAPELRRELHRQLALHLDERESGRAAERMVRHWEGCGELEKVRPYLVEAALGAARRQEDHRVIDFSQRAGFLSDALDPSAAAENGELAIRLSTVLERRGRRDEATRILETTRAGAEERADGELLHRVELSQVYAQYHKDAAAVDAGRIRAIADQFGRSRDGGKAHQLLGLLAKGRGDLEAAAHEFQTARDLFQAAGLDADEAAALDQLGSVAFRAGHHEQAEEFYASAETRSRRVGRVVSAAVSGVNRVSSGMCRGRLEGLAPVLKTAIRTFELAGSPHLAAHVRLTLAELHYSQGDFAGATRAADEAVPRLRQTQHGVALGAALRMQGNLLALQGDLERAEEKLEEARDLAEKAQDYGQQATTWAALAHLRCFAGDLERASAAARSALDLVKSTPQGIDDLLLLLAEACLYGLPRDVLAEASAAVPVGQSEELHAHVLAGAVDYACKDGLWESLSAAASALRTNPIVPRQAVLRIVADWFEAEALRRRGDIAGSKRAARRGLDAAAALKHVRLQTGLERFLVDSVGLVD